MSAMAAAASRLCILAQQWPYALLSDMALSHQSCGRMTLFMFHVCLPASCLLVCLPACLAACLPAYPSGRLAGCLPGCGFPHVLPTSSRGICCCGHARPNLQNCILCCFEHVVSSCDITDAGGSSRTALGLAASHVAVDCKVGALRLVCVQHW